MFLLFGLITVQGVFLQWAEEGRVSVQLESDNGTLTMDLWEPAQKPNPALGNFVEDFFRIGWQKAYGFIVACSDDYGLIFEHIPFGGDMCLDEPMWRHPFYDPPPSRGVFVGPDFAVPVKDVYYGQRAKYADNPPNLVHLRLDFS